MRQKISTAKIVVTMALAGLMLSVRPELSLSAPNILLRNETISTGVKKPSIQVMAEKAKQIGTRKALLQFKAPPENTWIEELKAIGVEFFDYIPEWAFVVRIPKSAAKAVAEHPQVHWIGQLKSEHKLVSRFPKTDLPHDVIISLFPHSNTDAVVAFIKSLGGTAVSADKEARIIRALVPGKRLGELATSDSVRAIDLYRQPRLANNAAQQITTITDARSQVGLFGQGQIVAIADTGLDVGPNGTLSADFAGRIKSAYALRRPNDWSDPGGHGTHTTGTLAGSGILSGANPAIHNYTNSFAGAAPEAQIVIQSIGDSGEYVFPPIDLNDLFGPAYADGARVHSNSWGSASNGAYTLQSQQVDAFAWNHRDMVLVFSAGNHGVDANANGVVDLGSIYSPASAKNCIAVGASENLRLSGGRQTSYGANWPSDFPVDPIKTDLMSNNINGMAAFSSRGPTADGRIKPDIVAPGTNIISARSHVPGSGTGWGVYNSHYVYNGGTSMSTPLVAGAAALVRENYVKNFNVQPSAALIKATILNTATDMNPGQYGTGAAREMTARPNMVQGWGRLNVLSAVAPAAPRVLDFVDEAVGIQTGQSKSYDFQVLSSAVPLRVTLVWTDPPGSVLAQKELVNDLNLVVTAPNSTQYRGNGTVDALNNVEGVDIATPQTGTWNVAIYGTSVPQGPQPFALVVTGALPGEYISGKITSANGNPIPGVQINVSGSSSKTTTTGANGEYTVRVPAGSYSVTPVLAGWTFDPPSRNVNVVAPGAQNVDFGGSGIPGSITGTVTRTVGGVTEYILESLHPYMDHSDITWTITANPSATKIRVHFAEIQTEQGPDVIYVMDGNDVVKEQYSGSYSDIWSPWVNGNVIKIRLVSDDSLAFYGFYIDGYETDLISQGGESGITISVSPNPTSTQTGPLGTYTISNLEPLPYNVFASKSPWKFQPSVQIANVPPGGTASGIDFAAFPPGSIIGMVKAGNSQQQFLSPYIQSEHPYNINQWQVWTINGPPNAERMRVHFQQIQTEGGFDWVYVMDGNDNAVIGYTGPGENDFYTDVWSPWVNGNVIKIAFSSDEGGGWYWGFLADKYQAIVDAVPVGGALIQIESTDTKTESDISGYFNLQNIEAGVKKLIASKPNWTFDPTEQLVNVVSGQSNTAATFWATVGELSDIQSVKEVPDGLRITLNEAIVTAGTNWFSGFCYVENADRTSGIRVNTSASVTAGQKVKVVGVLATINGERQINASSVTVLP